MDPVTTASPSTTATTATDPAKVAGPAHAPLATAGGPVPEVAPVTARPVPVGVTKSEVDRIRSLAGPVVMNCPHCGKSLR